MVWQYIVIILLAVALASVGVWSYGLRRRLADAERAAVPQSAPPPVTIETKPALPKIAVPPARPAQLPAPAPLPETATPGALPESFYSVPDSTADGARLGRLIVRSAATRGERARLDGRVRRNEVWTSVLNKFEPQALLSCISSGVSSSDHSYLGAVQVCRSLHGRLAEITTALAIDTAWKTADDKEGDTTAELRRLLRSLVASVGNSVTQAADDKMLDPADLATGLIFLLTRLGDTPRRQHLLVGVGDGALLRLTPKGKWSQEPLDAGPGPAVLPASADQLSLRQLTTAPGDVLVLCSAATAPVLKRGEEDGAVVNSAWQSGPPDLVRFLWHLNQADPLENDDRAAVAIWESPVPEQARRSDN